MVNIVCAATSFEANACSRGFKKVPSFKILQTGMGPERATRALRNELSRLPYGTVQMVISSGFAGSLSNEIKVGEWVCASDLWLRKDQKNHQKLEQVLFQNALANWNAPFQIRSVPILSLDEIQNTPFDPLPDDRPWCVDMESAFLAKVCREYEIPFAVLRMISDSPEKPIPAFISQFANSPIESIISALQNPAESTSFVFRSAGQTRRMQRDWEELSFTMSDF